MKLKERWISRGEELSVACAVESQIVNNSMLTSGALELVGSRARETAVMMGRLVEVLVDKRLLDADDVRTLLPSFEVVE